MRGPGHNGCPSIYNRIKWKIHKDIAVLHQHGHIIVDYDTLFLINRMTRDPKMAREYACCCRCTKENASA